MIKQRLFGLPVWFLVGLLGAVLLAAVLVPVVGLAAQRRWTADQVVAAFEAAGLEASDSRPMTLTDLAAAPNLADEALLFPIWSLKGCFCAEEPRGFVMTLSDPADLSQVKAYYDDLSKQSVVFQRWSFARNNVLVVIPGAVTQENAEEYRLALERM